ncbi:gala protein [Nocardiopsis sp. N85]|uniref:gala protein n=1 Tax=Nocardiopsis sp. N85 TaxID=3029400 RepID=UPI00237F0BA7|nr:gala protein [Nocardiopsis sp. N85]MDE3724690.1 gala protein [Nocardiopsis sp. N85]
MTEKTPVRCPAIEHPDLPRADPAALEPLLARLADPAPVTEDETFPSGTLRPDGRVDLCKQGLGPPGARRVVPAAATSPHAAHLLLGTNAIGSEGARVLADALAGEHGLQTLYLGCNRIGADGAVALADRLADDDTVRALWLKRNPVGDEGARAVAGALARNRRLRSLDLVNTGVGAEGLRSLLETLVVRAAPMERLFLGGNGLGPDSAALLAAFLRDAGVRELYAPANHLGDEGARTIAAAVADLDRPVTLGLGGNGIGAEGAFALAGALGGIEALDLGRPRSQRALGAPSNELGDAGVTALAEAIPDSPLRRLEVRHTGFGFPAASALSDAVARSGRMEYAGLGPGLPRRTKRTIARHLRPARGAHDDLRAIGSLYR